MHISQDSENAKRRAVNLTIREDIVQEAKSLKLNTSKAAESGIINAIKNAKEELWLEQNKKALDTHNERIEKNGLLLKANWVKD